MKSKWPKKFLHAERKHIKKNHNVASIIVYRGKSAKNPDCNPSNRDGIIEIHSSMLKEDGGGRKLFSEELLKIVLGEEETMKYIKR